MSVPAWARSAEQAAAAGMALAWQARTSGERLAVLAPAGERSFAELDARANQLARLLRRHGLAPDSGVALICSNRAEFIETHAAALRTGLRLTPVNWHLTGEEMAYIVADCEARALIAEDRFAAPATAALRAATGVRVALGIGQPMPGFDDYERALAVEQDGAIEAPQLGSPMLYTSGTTGRPKGVYRWPARPASLLRAILDGMPRFDPAQDTALVTGPLYHAAPLNLNALAALHAGVGLVLMDHWDAAETLHLIETHRVTYTHMVATMFHRLLQLPAAERAGRDLSSLRAVLHGAAPCPAHVKHAMIDWLGPVLYEYYAATEGGGTLIDSHSWRQRPGSVGRALPGCGVRVLDAQGVDAAAGEPGTVYLRAPPEGRFVYFKADDKTAGSYRGDHFTLGDQGYLDADGFLYLTGRSAELIISGGVNIYPQEIDDVLLGAEGVLDACTIGVPDEEWGESVLSLVVPRPGAASDAAHAAALLAHCRAHLAGFKCPRHIEFTDQVPRLPSGKLLRHRARAAYWPQASQTPAGR